MFPYSFFYSLRPYNGMQLFYGSFFVLTIRVTFYELVCVLVILFVEIVKLRCYDEFNKWAHTSYRFKGGNNG